MLEELPKSLDETYQRILKEINNANHKQAHQLLQCLAVAQRPLRVEELAEVLALDVDAGGIPRFNAKWRWEDHEAAVLSACSSLVSVITDDGSRVVQFSHFSVKEFLTSDRLASMEDVSHFHIADEPSHVILAQACLGVILSMDVYPSENSLKEFALLPYADEYWDRHAGVGEVELRIKDALDCFFNLEEPHFEAHIEDEDLFRLPSDKDPRGVLSPAAPFCVACQRGLMCLAKRLIESNQQHIIECRVFGWTLLHVAVDNSDFGTARLLLAHGADVNSRSDYAARTPPHIASLQSQSDVDNVDGTDEIENSPQISGSDVSSESSMSFVKGGVYDDSSFALEILQGNGFTPLHLAVLKGHLDMCQMLLKHQPDLRAQDNKGNTPLHVAATGGHLEVARMLLECKADVDSLNGKGFTPLHRASKSGRRGCLDIVRLLLDHGVNVNVHYDDRNTPLHFAAAEGHLEIVRLLLEHKADVGSLNGKGSTPLHRASAGRRDGCIDIVRLLLDHDANVNIHDNHRNTPLHFAVSKGSLEVVRMLLEHKADVNALNEEGSTPLHRAFEHWRGDIVWLFVNHGADVKGHDESGNTLLHLAASEGDLELARMGIERNVDVNSQNNDGLTALLFALSRESLDVARLLLDHNADVHVRDERGNTPLHVGAMFTGDGHLVICRILLERKAEVNSQNHHGSTPLLIASERGDPELVQLFLDHNADPHGCDNDGDTLLHCAALGGQVEVVRLLLKLNAEVNSQNNKGSTPLHLASAGYPYTERNGTSHLDVVQLLLDHGADMQIRNLDGKTASQVARGPKQQEIVLLLSPHAAG